MPAEPGVPTGDGGRNTTTPTEIIQDSDITPKIHQNEGPDTDAQKSRSLTGPQPMATLLCPDKGGTPSQRQIKFISSQEYSDIKLMNFWTSEIESILPSDLFLYGYKVREKVKAFFLNAAVSDATKTELAAFMATIKHPDILQIYVASTVLEGQERVDQLWREGFGRTLDSDAARYAQAAAEQCELRFEDRVETLKACYFDRHSPEAALAQAVDSDEFLTGRPGESRGVLAVLANPVFVSVLTEDSLVLAVAHEFYHHRDNHYRTMSDLIRGWISANPAATKAMMGRVRDLAEWSVDTVVNHALGATRIEFNVGSHGDDGRGRRLLTAAAAGGGSLAEEADGRLAIPLITAAAVERKLDVRVDPRDPPAVIFATLLAADSGLRVLPRAN